MSYPKKPAFKKYPKVPFPIYPKRSDSLDVHVRTINCDGIFDWRRFEKKPQNQSKIKKVNKNVQSSTEKPTVVKQIDSSQVTTDPIVVDSDQNIVSDEIVDSNEMVDSNEIVDSNQAKIDKIVEEKSKKQDEGKQYEYLSLTQVQLCFPIKTTKYVCIYGIIESYHENIMTLIDEDYSNFRFFPNLFELSKGSSLRDTDFFQTGDIIRVHRLALNTDLTKRSTHIRNIVIFQSFLNNKFKPRTVAQAPTYTDYDHKRVDELTQLNIKNLIHNPICKVTDGYSVLNICVQCLDIKHLDKYSLICAWSPTLNSDASNKCPQFPPMRLNMILDNIWKNKGHYPFEEIKIRKLYENRQLIFISVFGKHCSHAKSINNLDTIVVYNLIRKTDPNHPGFYSYLLYDGNTYGQCIRIAEPASLIANSFSEEINRALEQI